MIKPRQIGKSTVVKQVLKALDILLTKCSKIARCEIYNN